MSADPELFLYYIGHRIATKEAPGKHLDRLG